MRCNVTTALNKRPNAEDLPRESAAAALLNGHYAPPPADKDGKTWVRTSALIQADPRGRGGRQSEARRQSRNTLHHCMRPVRVLQKEVMGSLRQYQPQC